MKTTEKPCFSNGTEYMTWQEKNCYRCVKATWYNEKTKDFPPYRCQIQGQIDGQTVGLDEINQRTYEAAQQAECPYKKTERKIYKKRVIKNQTNLEL